MNFEICISDCGFKSGVSGSSLVGSVASSPLMFCFYVI